MLGEDSGIEVEVLGGAPGVHSARWAEDPIARLLARLEGETDRRARYVSELVGLGPGGEELRGTGRLEGRVAEEARGSEGFGYDPVFVPEGEERTVAELGNEWKSAKSHRALAARALRAALASAGRGPGTRGAS
jgi:XTP/dITP diphosphohydrolase